MFTQCILHIGMEKTGTTTIQSLLSSNREPLAQAGYAYSRTMGRDNHVNLVVYSRDDDTTDNQRKRALARKSMDIGAFRSFLDDAFAQEADRQSGKILVLSNEHLQSRLTNIGEKERLRTLLVRHCEGLPQIYLYLRRQDLVAISLYGTRLLSGAVKTLGRLLPKISGDDLPYFYDYLRIWREWSAVFGRENVHVRLFDATTFPEGDVGLDFLNWTGISTACPLPKIPRQNEAISRDAQYLMSRMNTLNPPFHDATPNPLRGRADHRVIRLGQGTGLQPARSAAEAFYGAFRQDNATLFAELGLPGGNFPEDFDRFPATVDTDQVDLRGVADLGVRLYMDVMEELVRTQADLKALRLKVDGD